MQWDKNEFDPQFTPDVYILTPKFKALVWGSRQCLATAWFIHLLHSEGYDSASSIMPKEIIQEY